MNKQQIVNHILRNTNHDSLVNEAYGYAFAPANIALCKYWGKSNQELNLPYNSSLSISLGNKGAFTFIKEQQDNDCFILNGEQVNPKSNFAIRLSKFLDLFRPTLKTYYVVDSSLTIPVAAGLASSACGFAALIQALNNLYNWRLDKKKLSILARLGSGSACRSLWNGFVEWPHGEDINGMDSYGALLDCIWPELRIGIITISSQVKPISSRDAMLHTVQTSPFYDAWIKKAEQDFINLKQAITTRNFELLGKISEHNALCMHATMMGAYNPIIYTQPKTLTIMRQIWDLRNAGFAIFFTQDAGPNLKLLFLQQYENLLTKVFPKLEIITPFADTKIEPLILVDENDTEIGVGEKMAAHKHAKLHRAFSVFVIRKRKSLREILMQQRGSNKYHSANLWTNTCCGHPRPGEDILVAATRRLKEEMGISTQLKEIGTFHYRTNLNNDFIENEIDHVFIGNLDTEIINYNPKEVQTWKWIKLNKLQQDLLDNPQQYTAWLQPALELLGTYPDL